MSKLRLLSVLVSVVSLGMFGVFLNFQTAYAQTTSTIFESFPYASATDGGTLSVVNAIQYKPTSNQNICSVNFQIGSNTAAYNASTTEDNFFTFEIYRDLSPALNNPFNANSFRLGSVSYASTTFTGIVGNAVGSATKSFVLPQCYYFSSGTTAWFVYPFTSASQNGSKIYRQNYKTGTSTPTNIRSYGTTPEAPLPTGVMTWQGQNRGFSVNGASSSPESSLNAQNVENALLFSSPTSTITTGCSNYNTWFTSGLCSLTAFLFVPGEGAINQYADFQSRAESKFPFNWFSSIYAVFSSATSSAESFPVVAYAPTSSPYNVSVIIFSTSTIDTYYTETYRVSFRILMVAVVYFLWGMHMWRRIGSMRL